MSWNGNDLFNSTLMGGMPSGADPHQYLTTDGNGKPHWEDKLAYEESAVVEIMPTTDVGTIWYSQKTVACPHNGAVKVGDTGYLYVDGTPYKYTAIEKVFGGGPPVVVQLDVEGQSNTGCLIGLTDDNKLLFYTCAYGSPMATHTVSMTHNSTTIKTIDPKYLPSGSGGGGAIYILPHTSGGYEAYADAEHTTMLSYEQGKAMTFKPITLVAIQDGVSQGSIQPLMMFPNDSEKEVTLLIASMEGAQSTFMTFSDTPES